MNQLLDSIEKEFCSVCGDQEGGCRQCGFGREYKKYLAERAAEKSRKETIEKEQAAKDESDWEKIRRTFK